MRTNVKLNFSKKRNALFWTDFIVFMPIPLENCHFKSRFSSLHLATVAVAKSSKVG